MSIELRRVKYCAACGSIQLISRHTLHKYVCKLCGHVMEHPPTREIVQVQSLKPDNATQAREMLDSYRRVYKGAKKTGKPRKYARFETLLKFDKLDNIVKEYPDSTIRELMMLSGESEDIIIKYRRYKREGGRCSLNP